MKHPFEDFVLILHNKGYTPAEIKLLWKNNLDFNHVYIILKEHGLKPNTMPKNKKCVFSNCIKFTKIVPIDWTFCPHCGKELHFTEGYAKKNAVDAHGDKIE
jgi:hypothetical protein